MSEIKRGASGVAPGEIERALALLVGQHLVAPAAGTAQDAARRMNAELLRRAPGDPDGKVLLSPVAATGVRVSWLEQLFLAARAAGQDPVSFAQAAIRANETAVEDVPADDADLAHLLQTGVVVFEERNLPTLSRLGIPG